MAMRMQNWLWLGTTIGGLALSIGLARSRTEEAAVALVGLFVFSLVLVSVATTLVQRRADAVSAAVARSVDVPLALLLSAAFLAFCFSVFLWFFAEKSHGIFVGLWVPSILALATVVLLTRRPPGPRRRRVREET